MKIWRSCAESPWMRPQRFGDVDAELDLPLERVRVRHHDRVADDVGDARVLDLQPDRPHEGEHLLDDAVGHLRFLDDVGEDGLRVRRVGQLTLEQARHHLDAGERVLDFVRDGGGHLAERGEPIAQPLALFELLDPGQVLEEQRRPDIAAARVLDQRECVADDLAAVLQAQLGAVGQMRNLERPGDDANNVGDLTQHFAEMPPDVAGARLQAEHAIGDLVHDRQLAVAGDGDHAVAQVPDQVLVEPVGDDAPSGGTTPSPGLGRGLTHAHGALRGGWHVR